MAGYTGLPTTPPPPLQTILPQYLYWQYSADTNLQAFVASFNVLAQSYLDWFNQTPLSVYTNASISGPLLDWVGNGVYGIPRPVLSTSSTTIESAYGRTVYAYPPAYGAINYMSSGTATIATDDIYKRVMTWILYRGDGQYFSIPWLKRRVARFLYGPYGSDLPTVLNTPPSVTISGSTYTITVPAGSSSTAFQQCMNNGVLPLPFQYNYTVVT